MHMGEESMGADLVEFKQMLCTLRDNKISLSNRILSLSRADIKLMPVRVRMCGKEKGRRGKEDGRITSHI